MKRVFKILAALLLGAACGAALGAGGQPEAPATRQTTDRRMRFDFVATSVDDILVQVAKEYGVVIVQAQRIPQKITINNPQSLDAVAGITLLSNILYQLNYAVVVNSTPDGQLALRILPLGYRSKPIAIYLGSDPREIPDDETLRTQIMPLKHLQATQLRQDVLMFLSKGADVTAGANSLIVTDTATKIHYLAEILEKLDVQPEGNSKPPASAPGGR
jgi:type II secretory pathway component GspD/PulD (secretin)